MGCCCFFCRKVAGEVAMCTRPSLTCNFCYSLELGTFPSTPSQTFRVGVGRLLEMASSDGAPTGQGEGSFMDQLIANAKMMPDSSESSSSPPSPSPCEVKCVTEQDSLSVCIESIRSAREAEAKDDSTTSTSSNAQRCLAPAVTAWTKCCSDANNGKGD